ncbi:MAG TPA: dihydroneopterin aldolase [Opitutaceae bacterium]|nr:dihydroneopterin aldolase [Opitutaceae bacterium]
MNGKIFLKNAVFYGHHGDLPEERTLGQRFILDLTLTVDLTLSAKTDQLKDTVDYVGIYELCREVIERERFNLLEALASRLADRILAVNTRVSQVDIVVKKPAVPLRGAVDYVSVELIKTRENSVPGSRQ